MWPTTSDTNIGSMTVGVEPSPNYPYFLHCYFVISVIKMFSKPSSVSEFHSTEKKLLVSLHRRLLTVNRDKTVDMSTVN